MNHVYRKIVFRIGGDMKILRVRTHAAVLLAAATCVLPNGANARGITQINISDCNYINDFHTKVGVFNSALVSLGDIYVVSDLAVGRVATLIPASGEVVSSKPIASRKENGTFKLDESLVAK